MHLFITVTLPLQPAPTSVLSAKKSPHPACARVDMESGGTRRRTGGEVKGKEANGVGSQAVFSFAWNSPSSVTTIFLPRPALQESQYSTELTPPPI